MIATPGRLLRWLAGLLVRGPGAPHVLGDLDESLQRDVARGMSLRRARARYMTNAVASAAALARARVRPGGPVVPYLGGSWLDVKLGLRTLAKHPVLAAVSLLSLALGIPVGLGPLHVAPRPGGPAPRGGG